jgi:hypothetical protein
MDVFRAGADKANIVERVESMEGVKGICHASLLEKLKDQL